MADNRAPLRLRLSRARGFNLQARSLAVNGLPATSVARPGPWGNPFVAVLDGSAAECVATYENLLRFGPFKTSNAGMQLQRLARLYAMEHMHQLAGRNLACWCKPGAPCHADVLLKLAREGWPNE